MKKKLDIILFGLVVLIGIAAIIVGVFDLVNYQSTIQHLIIILAALVIVINFGRAIILLKNFIQKRK